MMNFKRKLAILAVASSLSLPVYAANNFVVRKIEINGLRRVSASTVKTYIPIHVGQQYTQARSGAILEALYQTGFFSRVRLERQGNTLVVTVIERPTIGALTITGNKKIKSAKLYSALKKFGVQVGQVYDSAKVFEITQAIKQQYALMGRYDAQVKAEVNKVSRNRVMIHIVIQEGAIATVRKITIVGSQHFSQHKLLKNFKLGTPNILSFFTHNDRYSKMQLETDLQQLQYFYFNHGYLRFKVLSKEVKMTPDHKGVYITIHVQEGPVYRVSGYRLVGLQAHNPKVQSLVTLKKGAIFSRKQIMSISQSIVTYFANKGYAFPKILPVPKIDEANRTVFITLEIAPGDRVYVRRINFLGNYRTKNTVLRNELRQYESSLFSLNNVNESKRRLANLAYITPTAINVVPTPVAKHPDEVDLNYHVKETNAGRASVQGGYSDAYGFLYGASVSEPNFMGTGKYVSIGFTRNEYQGQYSFAYNNPFYRPNGISRGFSIFYNNTRPNKKLNYEPYTMDELGGSLQYGVPISEYNSLSFGVGYSHISISNVNTFLASPALLSFINRYKKPFNSFNISGGWSRSTTNRMPFPTDGSAQSLSIAMGAPIIKNSVGFYKAVFQGKWYFPLGHGFILNPHTNLGYGNGIGKGNGGLPFYQNFFAGGIETLPGFEPNTLGPTNVFTDGTKLSLGGNVEILGGINLIFPNGISQKVRTSLFFDGGNVFQTNPERYTAAQLALASGTTRRTQIAYEGIALKNMRAAAGVEVSWWSPMGPISVSIGQAVVKKKGDQTTLFGFAFGTSI